MTEVKLPPTPEQRAVVDGLGQADGPSLMVQAYAGAAKTSTLVMAAGQVKVPGLALAFNKKIAKELGARLPGQFAVKTLNGLGFAALTRGWQGVGKFELDDRKLGKLITHRAKEAKVQLAPEQWDQIRGLVTKAMLAGVTPDGQGYPLVDDTQEVWRGLAEELWVPPEDQGFIVEWAHDTLVESIAQARQGKISFDEQVYLPVCLGGRWPLYPMVFVDEAQDLSPLNHAMIGKVLRADARLLAVGDPKQAIYQFRGADSRSMESLRGLRPGWADRKLSMTFRCPKAIVERQQAHAPGFQAWYSNPEGRVTGLGEHAGYITWDEEADPPRWDWGDVVELLPAPGASVAILCRNNSPLLKMAFRLIRQGVGVVMLGRDLGKGLVALSRKICPDDLSEVEVFKARVRDWVAEQLAGLDPEDNAQRVESLTDRAECLLVVAESAQARDAGDVRAALERLFARESGLVTLGTIHKAKGLEWDLVVHLDPWRIPSRQARAQAKLGRRQALEQEWNLLYVVETRSKHTLVEASAADYAPGAGV